MTAIELMNKIRAILSETNLKVPKCFQDEDFLYCFCGKCEPKDYDLPKDFQSKLITRAVKEYKKSK